MNNKYTAKDHTFAICAYGESPYLEECISSVLKQKTKTNIIIATSTPSIFLENIAKKYDIPIYENKGIAGKSNIANDWNYAVSCVKTKLVTITHQDDTYLPSYSEKVISNMNLAKHPLIAFTDYSELRNGVAVSSNKLLNVKKVMLFPLRLRILWKSRFVRRRILSFGSAICCPSVTFNREALKGNIFVPGYRSDIDWQAWENISKMKGSFVYCNEILMQHRIHEDSATTAIIADNDRTKEDFEMYCKFWPKIIARLIEHYYRKGEDQNSL